MQTPEARTAQTKAAIAKHDVKPVEEVELKDPITGEKRLITLDRTGTTEAKLIQVLADPEIPRDRKDHAISMYLYERGAHNTSMIVDLFRYKGQHTKESRVFQSRMRLDFQTFVDSFTNYLHNQSRLLGITLGIDIKAEKQKFEEWLKLPNNVGKGYTYKDFTSNNDLAYVALVEMAIYAQDEADALRKGIEAIVKAREAMKGGGIYLDKMGRPYDVNDPALEEIIKAEREAIAEAEKDDDR